MILRNNMDCPESRRSPAAVFMPMLDSAEKSEPRGLTARMILLGRGVIDGVTPPISGLAVFAERPAAALINPDRKSCPDNHLS